MHVHQQAAGGDRHVYASRSRFIPECIVPLFEARASSESNLASASNTVLAAMFEAALMDFPRLGMNPRRVAVAKWFADHAAALAEWIDVGMAENP